MHSSSLCIATTKLKVMPKLVPWHSNMVATVATVKVTERGWQEERLTEEVTVSQSSPSLVPLCSFSCNTFREFSQKVVFENGPAFSDNNSQSLALCISEFCHFIDKTWALPPSLKHVWMWQLETPSGLYTVCTFGGTHGEVTNTNRVLFNCLQSAVMHSSGS